MIIISATLEFESSEARDAAAYGSADLQKAEHKLIGDARVKNVSAFIGAGPPRFYLPVDPELPYLDEIQFIFSPDVAGQVEALRGGQVQFVAGLTSELVDSIGADSNLKVITGPASAFQPRSAQAR